MLSSGWLREPRLEETKRIERVLEIICLISARPRFWTRRALSQRFEVSERMIDKDLQLVRHGLKFDLARTPQGYAFEREPVIKPLHLRTAEAFSLLLAAQQALATGAADRPSLAAALARLEDVLPEAVARHARAGLAVARSPLGVPARDRGAILLLLEQALAERRKVAMTYVSASRGGAITDRVIAPYDLIPHERSRFVVADDSFRNAILIFNADRIRHCRLTDDSYLIPGDYSLDSYLGSSWGMIRGQAGEPVDIALRFDAIARPWVEEFSWHPSQLLEDLPDGSLLVRFHCGITEELVRWILWYGSTVVVEQPRSLRDAVRREAEGLSERNG